MWVVLALVFACVRLPSGAPRLCGRLSSAVRDSRARRCSSSISNSLKAVGGLAFVIILLFGRLPEFPVSILGGIPFYFWSVAGRALRNIRLSVRWPVWQFWVAPVFTFGLCVSFAISSFLAGGHFGWHPLLLLGRVSLFPFGRGRACPSKHSLSCPVARVAILGGAPFLLLGPACPSPYSPFWPVAILGGIPSCFWAGYFGWRPF